MVPQLGTEKQILVFEVFHLTGEGASKGNGKSLNLFQHPLVRGERRSLSTEIDVKSHEGHTTAGCRGLPGPGADLLAEHIVVQLQLVEPLQLFGQPVITLPKLLDIIAGFGQNPTFALQWKPTGLQCKTPTLLSERVHTLSLLLPEGTSERRKDDCQEHPQDSELRHLPNTRILP